MLTSDQKLSVQIYNRTGYAPIERALAREHTLTTYLLAADTVIVDRNSLAEQLAQHTPRGRYA